jgi:hypothetical protein
LSAVFTAEKVAAYLKVMGVERDNKQIMSYELKQHNWIVKKGSSCKSCVFCKKGNLAGGNGKAAVPSNSRFFLLFENKGKPLFASVPLVAGQFPTIFFPYSLIVLAKVVALVGRSLHFARYARFGRDDGIVG